MDRYVKHLIYEFLLCVMSIVANRMMTVVRQLDRADRKALTLCAEYLIKNKHYSNAAEVYKKMGDVHNLALIYVKSCQWQEVYNCLILIILSSKIHLSSIV